MACQNCPNAKAATPAAVEPVPQGSGPLSYRATATTVTGLDGVRVSIAQPLAELREMRGGWGVKLPVRGHYQDIGGDNPHLVFGKAKRVLQTNNVVVSDLDLWFNLNIQWKERGILRKQTITLENLLAVAEGNAPPKRESAKTDNTGPAVWGPKGWAMLQMYLAQDVYEYGRFLQLATELLSWVNPDINPSIGCADCFRHFSLAVAELRNNPLHVQVDARVWLHRHMNLVRQRNGKSLMKYADAVKVNFWRS